MDRGSKRNYPRLVAATLQYGKDKWTSGSRPHLETSFGPGYWLVYDSWTHNTPGEEDIALMLRAAEALHNGWITGER